MRRILFLLCGVGILAVLGLQVRDSEALIAAGDRVLIDLAPVDPRSMMQGDYMRLAFAIERLKVETDDVAPLAVLNVDARGVATFARLGHSGETLAAGEHLFRVRANASGSGILIEPHSFLFQEGDREVYARAKFGIFRVDTRGRHLLVGLADADGKDLRPE